jgi:hypothetical protein
MPSVLEELSGDRDQPLHDLGTMDHRFPEWLGPHRFNTQLVRLFAARALILAAAGLSGVMSHSVPERTREIGLCPACHLRPDGGQAL